MRQLWIHLAAVSLVCVCSPSPVEGQHTAPHHPEPHRHRSGVNIVISGDLVDPVCRFARSNDDRAEADPQKSDCPNTGLQPFLPPVLLGRDSMLYLLRSSAAAGDVRLASLVGEQVIVRGTVYQAGSGYLILVDAVETRNPGTP